ncbi:MAG: aminotransferase class V-fold PLP-dependent enzyme [Myxococcaceae bacterium]|nr:aminotransferase class V-fold PLP-dependent enzyme [Myxococcaceae bacterium]
MAAEETRDSPFRHHWLLETETTFLNHGSFGACPVPVLEAQTRLRERMERQPLRFLARELEALLDEARAVLADFVGARPEGLAFVPNASTGVNTFLRAFPLQPGDEVVTTTHEYNASRNALEVVAAAAGARVVVAEVPWPTPGPEAVLEAVLAKVTPRTRLCLVDHITSQTGLVFPVERLVAELRSRGVETLVDGAHGPGQVPLALERLGAAAYTGNCHKWVCAPKGAAFLHVREDWQARVRPLVVSHGHNSPREDRSRFRLEFDWMGTGDPTSFLCVPEALRFVGGLLPGGWPAVMEHNRTLALRARRRLAERLGTPLPCPDSMVGSMAAVLLPDTAGEPGWHSPLDVDWVQEALDRRFKVEIPVVPFPAPPRKHVRLSAQLYNSLRDYERLGDALEAVL